MFFTVGLALLFLCVVVLLVNVLTQVDEKATVRASLRQLDGYEVSNVRDQELLKPVSERALELVRARRCRLGLSKVASDHLPIVADFRLARR